MSSKQDNYFKGLNSSLKNEEAIANVSNNLGNYIEAYYDAKNNYSNLNLARKRAANIRHKTTEYLDAHLINLEAEMIRRNIKVLWAGDADEANQEILDIIKSKNAKTVVKSKSTTLNEIGLRDLLNDFKINVVDTDTGDYLCGEAKSVPFQTILPLLDKSFEEINAILNKDFSDLHQASAFIASEITEKTKELEVFISGATFLLADIGGVVLTENEGNILRGLSNSDTHIVVCGIDKVLANVNDLDLMLPLLSTFATGQFNANYNTIINSPIGKSELIVILLDNGRSELLLSSDLRAAATCIKCGSCQLHDPLYKLSAKAQQGLYKGIIGHIINQHYQDESEHAYESFLNPLDGNLQEHCPIAIDFNKMLLYNRRDNVFKGLVPRSDNIAIFFYKGAVLKRSNMEKGGSKLKNFMLRQFFKKSWGNNREFPNVASISFNEQWREKNK
jgi:L-lactate dehydrogenase complex protein LldF